MGKGSVKRRKSVQGETGAFANKQRAQKHALSRNAKKKHEEFAADGAINSFGSKNYKWTKRTTRAKKSTKNVLTPKDCVKKLREDEIGAVEVTHAFADFGLDARLVKNVEALGYTQPMPIQDQAIGPVLKGRDVIGLAQTGTGKTAAFLLPLLTQVLGAPEKERVLVMAPTRELAQQTFDAIGDLAAGCDVRSVLVVGGANANVQKETIAERPQFIIGTPGRLHDLIEQSALDISDVTRVVIDEVDRMMDMGFVKEMKYLLALMERRQQTLLFSATLRKEMRQIAKSFQVNPVTVAITPRPTAMTVDQDVRYIEYGEDKMEALHDELIAPGVARAIVFVRTKFDAQNVGAELRDRGFTADVLQGDLSQGARKRIMGQFKDGAFNVLVATDVVARGIDVPNVTHVINYDVPDTYDDYVHRIGRTGRAGKTGHALTFWERG